MDEGPQGERVEIELTVDDRSRGRRRKRAAQPSPLAGQWTPPPPAGQPAETLPVVTEGGSPGAPDDRRRVVVTALVSAAIALFIGWAIGRSGGGDTPAANDAESGSTTVSPTTVATTSEGGVPVPSVGSEDLPTTPPTTPPIIERPPAGPTTTTVPEWVDSVVGTDPVFAESGLDVVMLSQDGLVWDVDLATGERSVIDLGLGQDSFPYWIEAGEDWLLVTDAMMRSVLVDRTGRVDTMTNLGQRSRLAGTADEFVELLQRSGSSWEVAITDLNGQPTREPYTVEVPASAWAMQTDPLGGLIIDGSQLGGGAFRVTEDGTSSRIIDGTLLAVSARTAVAVRCPDDLDSCVIVVRDRESALDRLFPLSRDGVSVVQGLWWYYGGQVKAISPTEDYVALLRTDSNYRSVLVVMSLTDGRSVEVSDSYSGNGAAWSPDGRFLLFADGMGNLRAYDTVKGGVYDASPDIDGPVSAFAIRV